MALNDRKIVNYANPVANLPDNPSQEGWTAAQLKAAFDANANEEIKTAINAIIDDLIAIDDGASGADNIGATAIVDLDGETVQSLIESIRNKLKSVTDGLSGADFVKATAIDGLEGVTVQVLLEALKGYVDIHKSSTDHDGRYYTETELKATDGVTGSNVIGAKAISGLAGTTVKAQIEALKTAIDNVSLGQIPDNSLTEDKLVNDLAVKINESAPTGIIVMWSGASTAIPSGWLLCDGTNGTPDLRGRFIVGAGGDYAVGNTGGEATHWLTTNEMPSHNHSGSTGSNGDHYHRNGTTLREYTMSNESKAYARYGAESEGYSSNDRVLNGGIQYDYGMYLPKTNASGSHTHPITIDNNGSGNAHENRPPYYALCYIMKVA